MRESGVYAFEELLSDVDGSQAFRWGESAVNSAAADSADTEDGPGMDWHCEPDDDDLEFSITPAGLAALINQARTHCADCAGACGR